MLSKMHARYYSIQSRRHVGVLSYAVVSTPIVVELESSMQKVSYMSRERTVCDVRSRNIVQQQANGIQIFWLVYSNLV